MKYFKKEKAHQITDLGKDLLRVAEFMKTGKDHGTVVEAMTTALRAAVSSEAKTVEQALQIGASEWYK